MMKLNQLPVTTFEKVGMNEATVDYSEGSFESIEINKDTVLELDKPGDINVKIHVKDKETLSVIMKYSFKDTLNVITDVDIEDGGKLKLLQIDSSDFKSRLINRVNANLQKEAEFNLAQILPGRGEVYSGCTAELIGNDSKVNMDVSYLAKDNQKVDLNYVANHRGKSTECHINADGVLKDKAEKTLRDTVNFITGAAGSKGIENEKVLLLGDDVVNKSIPLILCTEEDVEGAHGAQIGSLTDETLLYFAQRGLNKEQAEKMISLGSFNRLIKMIDDEEIKESTTKLVSEVL